MQYTSSTVYAGATWSSVSSAGAFYKYINSDGTSSVDTQTAQDESCQPLSMKGKVQDSTLATNRMIVGNNVVTTCTSYSANLWP